jgi:hypothetical protein
MKNLSKLRELVNVKVGDMVCSSGYVSSPMVTYTIAAICGNSYAIKSEDSLHMFLRSAEELRQAPLFWIDDENPVYKFDVVWLKSESGKSSIVVSHIDSQFVYSILNYAYYIKYVVAPPEKVEVEVKVKVKEKRSGWINIYKSVTNTKEYLQDRCNGSIFSTKDAALEAAGNYSRATIEINWEE